MLADSGSVLCCAVLDRVVVVAAVCLLLGWFLFCCYIDINVQYQNSIRGQVVADMLVWLVAKGRTRPSTVYRLLGSMLYHLPRYRTSKSHARNGIEHFQRAGA